MIILVLGLTESQTIIVRSSGLRQIKCRLQRTFPLRKAHDHIPLKDIHLLHGGLRQFAALLARRLGTRRLAALRQCERRLRGRQRGAASCVAATVMLL